MSPTFEVQKDYADKILREARDYYYKIRSIYDSTGYSRSYQLSDIWKRGTGHMRNRGNMALMIRIIDSDASAVDSIRLIDNTVLFSVNPADPIREKMVDWHIEYLRQYGQDISNLDITIQESPVTNPAVCVSREGRLLTPDFLERVFFYSEMRKYCRIPKSKFRIVELGGGCGRLARTLKLFIPNSVHLDIDLLESLHFAYLFTRLNFPEAKTCYVTDPSQLKNGIQEFDFVFIPTLFAESILENEFDLFCNTASLGEMTNPVIRYWMDFVQNRLKVKYFFGYNRYLNTIDDTIVGSSHSRLNENECSVLFDANWKILHWEVEPPFARCLYEKPMVARNLEIVAQRLPEASTNEYDNQLRSQQIVEELMDEDRWRLPNAHTHGTMRSNVLVNDLTMSGTLFKLWESIRLYPNKTNVAMMLQYLHALTKRDYPFEEWFYYRNLLKSLVSRDVRLYPGTTLAEEKSENLWKRALALSVSYNPFSIRAWYHYILRLSPQPIRRALMRLLWLTVYHWLSPITYLVKIKRSFTS